MSPHLILTCAVAAVLVPVAARAECDTANLLEGRVPTASSELQGDPRLATDGAVAEEGARWDAPAVVTLMNGAASVTYDLGAARSISAVYLQADANDTYQLSGSLDGAPGSYRPLIELPNVRDRGHGLRGRAVELAPVTVRYVRLGDARGDDAYSFSELAVYCRAPKPFPPAWRLVEAPRAVAEPPPLDVVERRDNAHPRFWLLALAGALVVAGAGLVRRPQRAAPAGQEPDLAASGATPVAATTRRAPRGSIHLMFLASGCAALVYEIVWLHLLRLVIGASSLSVGIVLASFMGGMFLGSLLFSRFVSRSLHPLRVYGLLEIGIGVFGLLMPLVLPAVRSVYVGLVGYGALGIALRTVIAAAMLLPPTALMGATLPAIARRYSSSPRGMASLASLYAANTIGAVLGSLLAGVYLLAVWDVWRATLVAVALNLAIGWAALRLARRTPPEEEAESADAAIPAHETSAAWGIYVATALSGLTALGAQVVWTRLLTLLLGATVYAFAIILAVFLGGLGIGSLVATARLRRGESPTRDLAWSQLGLVPAMLLGAWLLADVLPFASPVAAAPVHVLHALHVLRAAAVILPAAVLWGMSFPLALAAAGAGHGDTGRSSGQIYAANTVGAIVGALGISFWVIPSFGTRWAEQVLVIGAAASAAALFLAMRRAPGSVSRRVPPPAWALAAGLLAAAVLPGLSRAFQAHGRYIWWMDPADTYPYVSEGASSTVAVHVAPDGYRNFHVSGRVEASDNPNDMRLQRLLGHLSALAHPRPESVLVVGLGAGVTAGSFVLHPEVKRIVICEIEPRVVGAAQQFARENHGVLTDPRVQVVFDDARHFLATTRERFDVITSDPIHPWVRGNSVLFSREYYAIVKDRLAPGGLATQWVPLYETSEEAIRIQMRTFTDAFPEGTVWNSHAAGKGYDVVLLGQAAPLRLDLRAMTDRLDRSPRILQALREVKISSALDLLATYGTTGEDMKTWLADAPVNRDFSLKLEYISGLALNQKAADPIYRHMVAGRSYPERMFVAPPELDAELRRRILRDR